MYGNNGYKNGILDIELSNNFFLRFSFDENLIVNINLFKNKIAQISVLNNYLGKFKGIGIGSTLGELLKKYPNIIYDNDENFFIIPEYKSVCFFFENPYEKEQLDNKIEEITLNSYELIKYPFLTSTKNKRMKKILKTTIFAVLLVGIGYAGYHFFF